ncbi:hypothetical protein SUGI_0514610 [Cryptomeria japonica]|nr:hypothetical protein SUGI_0514610 [Cryptomeria japonica]
MNLDVSEPWLVEPVIAIHDLDNIVLKNLGDVRITVVRKKGKEKGNLLSATGDIDDNGHAEEGEQMKQKGWKKGLLKWASGLISGEGTRTQM